MHLIRCAPAMVTCWPQQDSKCGLSPPGASIFCLVAQVRFFGKFLGTHADYYVFETTLKSPPEEPEQQLGERALVMPSQPRINFMPGAACSCVWTPDVASNVAPHCGPAIAAIACWNSSSEAGTLRSGTGVSMGCGVCADVQARAMCRLSGTLAPTPTSTWCATMSVGR